VTCSVVRKEKRTTSTSRGVGSFERRSPWTSTLGDRRLSTLHRSPQEAGQALRTTSDLLLFDQDERGPDDDLRLQFEAVRRLDPDEKLALKTVIEGVITKHEVKRLASA
jgi:hypothetical protein